MPSFSFFKPLVAALATLAFTCLSGGARGADMPQAIRAVKPSVVAIATYQKTRSPALRFRGTGFAVGDGLSIVTNFHVLPTSLDEEHKEILGIVTGSGPGASFRPTETVAVDKEHDLAHLRLGGTPLPALKLGDSDRVEEGQSAAFTGFPLGMMLGAYHVTHRAMVSSIAPLALPAQNSGRLDARILNQLKAPPFAIFQLDATAYPGNSGSPLYDPESGEVLGVINKVLVAEVKEAAAISNPSGITYAVPGNHVRELLRRGNGRQP